MADSTSITIRVSPGEILDRLTILEIKAERMTEPAKLANVRHELDELAAVVARRVPQTPEIKALHDELKGINAKLWDIEDEIRDCERARDFGEKFVALARAVYHTNDSRAAVKRRINDTLGADIIEEKSYAPY